MWSLNAPSESASPAGALNGPAEPLMVEQLQLNCRLAPASACKTRRGEGAGEEVDTGQLLKMCLLALKSQRRGAGVDHTRSKPHGAFQSCSD